MDSGEGLERIEFWMWPVDQSSPDPATTEAQDEETYVDFDDDGWKGQDEALVEDNDAILRRRHPMFGVDWKTRVRYKPRTGGAPRHDTETGSDYPRS